MISAIFVGYLWQLLSETGLDLPGALFAELARCASPLEMRVDFYQPIPVEPVPDVRPARDIVVLPSWTTLESLGQVGEVTVEALLPGAWSLRDSPTALIPAVVVFWEEVRGA